jgi:beta-galactosidase
MNNKPQSHEARKQGPAILASAFLFLLLVIPLIGFASGKPSVFIKKFKNSHYQLFVEGKPFIIKGVCYNPVAVGKNHEYDWWNDPNKPWLVDGKLMQEMGINAVRLYETGEDPEKVRIVIRDLYEKFGIRTALGSWLGFWNYPCPLYGNKEFQEKVKNEVLEMVRLYKDEPGVLCWILGNENNYSCLGRVNPWSTEEIDNQKDPRTQQFMRAKIYYSYVNDIAKGIKKIDKNHPVALGNGELFGLDSASQFCKDIDVIACIIYRGKSFGNLFSSLKTTFDRPVFLSEFGADCYDAYNQKEDQHMQAFFLESQWRQIYNNLSLSKQGAGNCLGGFMFEWTDEWWKNNEASPDSWKVHDTGSNWSNGSYYFDNQAPGNKNMNEEWFGIVGLSEELEQGLNKRTPRKAYYVIREFWKTPQEAILTNNKKR